MSATTKVFRPSKTKIGYWQRLGLPDRGPRLYAALEKGFSYQVYDALAKQSGIEKRQLAASLSISPATLVRRAKAGHFTSDESDRLYRFAAIVKAAIDLFEGDERQAQSWLTRASKSLGDKSPLQMMRSATEAQAVDELIARLEHGIIV